MTINVSGAAAIAGVANTEFSKNSGVSELELASVAVRDAKLMRGGSDIGAEMQTAVERSLAIPEGHLTRFFAELTG